MKKYVCMYVCMLFFILSESFAIGISVSVDNFTCDKIVNKKIYGSFEVTNLYGNYYDRLSYVLYLIPARNIDSSSFNTMSLAESKSTSFSILPNETKFIAYEFEYPKDMPFDQYTLALSIFDGSDDLYLANKIENLQIGKEETEYIISDDMVDPNYYKIENYEGPLSGPNVDVGDTLKGYINIKSKFEKDKKITPQYLVFERNLAFSDRCLMVEKGESILVKPDKSKEVELKIPIYEKPGAYFTKVRFLDENDKVISGEYYFRYVVKGDSAKISSIGLNFDPETDNLKVSIGYLGAADGSTIKDAVFATAVYENENYNNLEFFADKNDIVGSSFVSSYSVKVPEDKTDFTVWATIKKDDNELSKEQFSFNINDIISDGVLKFNDLTNTKYEYYVKVLESYGVISGYPDGTFRPNKTLTRAELTAIALNMKDVDLSDYEVKTNNFTDLEESHWAYKLINYAAENGIVNGYGNGLFKPNSEVKYSEAITILTNVAGYSKKVNSSTESWPYNYISFANQYNLLNDTEIQDYLQVASRGEVAIIALNNYYVRKD